jgi:hypothetical protein
MNNKISLKYIPLHKLKYNKEHIRLEAVEQNNKISKEEITNYYMDNLSIRHLILSIGQNGYFDIEPLIVVKSKNKYKVIDGNLRLASLIILSNIDIIENQKNLIKKILNHTTEKPTEIPCIIIDKKISLFDKIGYKHIMNNQHWNIPEKLSYINKYYDWFSDDDIDTNSKEIAISIGTNRHYVQRYILTSKTIQLIQENYNLELDDLNIKILSLNFLNAFKYDTIITFLNINLEKLNPLDSINYNNIEILRDLFNKTILSDNYFSTLNETLSNDHLKSELEKGNLSESRFIFNKEEFGLDKRILELNKYIKRFTVTDVEKLNTEDMKVLKSLHNLMGNFISYNEDNKLL